MDSRAPPAGRRVRLADILCGERPGFSRYRVAGYLGIGGWDFPDGEASSAADCGTEEVIHEGRF